MGNTFPGKQVVFNVAHMVKNANSWLLGTLYNYDDDRQWKHR